MDSESTSQIHPAGFWVRGAAYFLDGLWMWLLQWPLSRVMPAILAVWVLPAAAVVLFWITKATTPGKMLFGLVICDKDTFTPPSPRQCVGRYLGYFVSLIPFGLGYFWAGWDAQKQTFHDKLAGTLVVYKKPEKTLSTGKILLVISGLLVVLGVFSGVAGYRWFASNKESLVENAKVMKEEATKFAAGKTDAAVLEEALRRHRACDNFLCYVQNNVFLAQALDASQPTENFCRDVPAELDLVRSVGYRLTQCQERGLNDRYCGNLFGQIEKYCDKRKKTG